MWASHGTFARASQMQKQTGRRFRMHGAPRELGDAERAARALRTSRPRAAALLLGDVPLAPVRRRPGARHLRGAAARAEPVRSRAGQRVRLPVRRAASSHQPSLRQQKRWVALDTDDDTSPAHDRRSRGPADEIARSEITRGVPPRHARTAAAASRSHRALRSRRTAIRTPWPAILDCPDRHRTLAPASRACAAHHSPGLARTDRSRRPSRRWRSEDSHDTKTTASARRGAARRNIARDLREPRPVMTWMHESTVWSQAPRKNSPPARQAAVGAASSSGRRRPVFAALAIGAGIFIGMNLEQRARTGGSARHAQRCRLACPRTSPCGPRTRWRSDPGGIFARRARWSRSIPHSQQHRQTLLDRRRGFERRHLPHRAHRARGRTHKKGGHDGIAPQIQ